MRHLGDILGKEINTKRIEHAMVLVAQHIARHASKQEYSPFTVIFERLEKERERLLDQNKTIERAFSFLNQNATRESQPALTSKVEPEP